MVCWCPESFSATVRRISGDLEFLTSRKDVIKINGTQTMWIALLALSWESPVSFDFVSTQA